MVAPDRLGYPENNPEKNSGLLRWFMVRIGISTFGNSTFGKSSWRHFFAFRVKPRGLKGHLHERPLLYLLSQLPTADRKVATTSPSKYKRVCK
jgi:hypothetical protein